jgi:hypothetical protein
MDLELDFVYSDDPNRASTLTGLGGEKLYFKCTQTLWQVVGGVRQTPALEVLTDSTMIFRGERATCTEKYGTCDELMADGAYGRAGGPYPNGWSDADKYEYYRSLGLDDSKQPYSGKNDRYAYCVEEDNPVGEEGTPGLGYADVPSSVSITHEDGQLCVVDAVTGAAMFTKRSARLSISDGVGGIIR